MSSSVLFSHNSKLCDLVKATLSIVTLHQPMTSLSMSFNITTCLQVAQYGHLDQFKDIKIALGLVVNGNKQ